MAINAQLPDKQADAFGNVRECPDGTIPMRRITIDEISKFGAVSRFLQKLPRLQPGGEAEPQTSAAQDHLYARVSQSVVNHGGSSVLNIWDPTPTLQNFSLSQCWYAGETLGSPDKLQTIEGGWQVYPLKYQTDRPALFIYWTADNYRSTGNYNLDAPSFVQTNKSSWVLGVGFDEWSVRDGSQREIRMQWQRDPANGNWWLFLQGGGALTALGYYPASLFGTGQLTSYATGIYFGGEVSDAGGGQMGSGELANAGPRRAAYQRQVAYFASPTSADWADIRQSPPISANYTVDAHEYDGTEMTPYFYFGGPGT